MYEEVQENMMQASQGFGAATTGNIFGAGSAQPSTAAATS